MSDTPPRTAPPDTLDPFGDMYIRERILSAPALARLHAWGMRDYAEILELQQTLRSARQTDSIPDTWLMGEHPNAITQGVRGIEGDVIAPGDYPVYWVDRGGQTTIHNPGQLVIYPIVRVQGGLLAQARVSLTLLTTAREWLRDLYGVELEIVKGRPGLFFEGRKLAAIGLSIRGHVAMHGIAINLCNDLSPWRAIVPCGEPDTLPGNLSETLGRKVEPAEMLTAAAAWIGRAWGYAKVRPVAAGELKAGKSQAM